MKWYKCVTSIDNMRRGRNYKLKETEKVKHRVKMGYLIPTSPPKRKNKNKNNKEDEE